MAYWREIGGSVTEENWPILLWSTTNISYVNPTTLTTFGTYTMPAGTMGANDSILIYTSWNSDYSAAGVYHQITVDFNTTTIADYTWSANYSTEARVTTLTNQNSVSSQLTGLGSGTGTYDYADSRGIGRVATQCYTATENTSTTSIPIYIKGKFGASSPGDYLYLDAFILLYRQTAGT